MSSSEAEIQLPAANSTFGRNTFKANGKPQYDRDETNLMGLDSRPSMSACIEVFCSIAAALRCALPVPGARGSSGVSPIGARPRRSHLRLPTTPRNFPVSQREKRPAISPLRRRSVRDGPSHHRKYLTLRPGVGVVPSRKPPRARNNYNDHNTL
ncbi:hypothetical protein NDU88_006097 [Pleurodeles waltl]|uniref:Uncharacterized protein n=1 Tax=Pleurodeles waltl TaxID=8319 RepID=A0AAV7MZY5_PLEWA|nr:hypothetical protein NDU88_006097 [Pleurodeles waltl]